MSGGATFEERIGEVLAELYDGASLMTGDASGAADLVVSVSAEAARTYERFERPPDFRTWIVGAGAVGARALRRGPPHVDRAALP